MDIKQSDIEILKSLQNALNAIPPNGNAEPRYWVIRDTVEYVGHPDYSDTTTHVTLPTRNVTYPLDDFIKALAADDFAELEDLLYGFIDLDEAKTALLAITCSDSALNFIHKYFDETAELIEVFEEFQIVSDTFFLTEQSALDYLKRYGYNHGPKAHAYGMTAIRSPEYEQLLQVIKRIKFD